jgi:hypothetical protein
VLRNTVWLSCWCYCQSVSAKNFTDRRCRLLPSNSQFLHTNYAFKQLCIHTANNTELAREKRQLSLKVICFLQNSFFLFERGGYVCDSRAHATYIINHRKAKDAVKNFKPTNYCKNGIGGRFNYRPTIVVIVASGYTSTYPRNWHVPFPYKHPLRDGVVKSRRVGIYRTQIGSEVIANSTVSVKTRSSL